jgi:hypothetical protein
MQEGIKYVISADVKQAVKGIDDVQKGLKKLPGATNQATFALTNFGRVVQDAPFGIIGIANNIDPLIQSFTQLKASTGSTSLAFKALGSSLLGPAGVAVAISAVTSLLVVFAQRQQKVNSEVKEAKNDTDSYVRKLTEQKEQLAGLVKVVKDQSQAEETRNNALQKLNDIIPDSIGKLTQKNIVTAEGVNIIAKYVKSLEAQATAELLINRIAENNIKLFDNRNKQLATAAEFEAKIANIRLRIARFEKAGNLEVAAELSKTLLATQKEYEAVLKEGRVTSEGVLEDNKKIRSEYENILPATVNIKKIGEETGKVIGKNNDLLKEQLQIIERIGLGEETKFQRDLRNLQEKIKKQEEFNKLSSEVLQNAKEKIPQPGTNGINVDGFNFGGSFEPATKEIDKMLISAKQLSDTINNGIGGGIDTFFNALANNQDPFKALAQSVQRLVVELAAAVVKALLLKAITAAITGGGSAVGGAATKGLDMAILRGGILGR